MTHTTSRLPASRLWAITSYFNPGGFHTRRENYRVFRRMLGIPLLTVELGGANGFDLTTDAAEVLIQLEQGDLLWQKERLLNIALSRLPPSCEVVAWIDCDVLFADSTWPERVEQATATSAIVQVFDRLVHLGRGEYPDTAALPGKDAERISFAAAWNAERLPADFFRQPQTSLELRCNCGMAWAARRDVLEEVGFYDAMVLGMGDKHLAAAAVGRSEDAVACMEMSEAHADHYRRWADRFGRRTGGRVGHLEGTVYHLWHGHLSDRHYTARYRGFRSFEFDPRTDLGLDRDGAWLWGSQKPSLHEHVASYFHSRYEDGRSSLDLSPSAVRA